VTRRARATYAWIAGATGLYLVFLAVSDRLMALAPSATFVGLPVLLLLVLTNTGAVRASGMSREQLGLSRPAASTWKSVLWWTLPLIGAMLAAKAALLGTGQFPEERLFDLGRHHQHLGAATIAAVLVLYTVLAPAQEYISRSAIQAPVDRFSGHSGLAILVAACLYAGSHLHLSWKMALAVFPLGVYWGFMFRRERNMWLVAASHAVAGHVGFLVIGFDGILRQS